MSLMRLPVAILAVCLLSGCGKRPPQGWPPRPTHDAPGRPVTRTEVSVTWTVTEDVKDKNGIVQQAPRGSVTRTLESCASIDLSASPIQPTTNVGADQWNHYHVGNENGWSLSASTNEVNGATCNWAAREGGGGGHSLVSFDLQPRDLVLLHENGSWSPGDWIALDCPDGRGCGPCGHPGGSLALGVMTRLRSPVVAGGDCLREGVASDQGDITAARKGIRYPSTACEGSDSAGEMTYVVLEAMADGLAPRCTVHAGPVGPPVIGVHVEATPGAHGSPAWIVVSRSGWHSISPVTLDGTLTGFSRQAEP